ncbi:MAG: tyrosine-type recombinase/integrase [Sphingobacterium sp.]|jgi:site-specific recombinase XerD|uniref:site-specific integrase n=1 Tax=Sphingobacterium sp. TaxID=341027 RepID=UPI00283C5284|nr:site-specific integrase [Sphingobacterium sp.]MDR3008657.1 tyrosine-type recombinase/integrase [Sphingobacterium sp.]
MEKIKHELDLLPMVLRTKIRMATGKAPLIVRITLKDQQPKEVPVGTTILPENWSVDTKTVRKADPEYKAINNKIKGILVDLSRVYDKLFLEYDQVSPLMIKRAYFGKPPIEPPKKTELAEVATLLKSFDNFIENFEVLTAKKKRAEGTLRQWKATKKKVFEYLRYRKRKNQEEKEEKEEKEITDFKEELTRVDIHFNEINATFGNAMYEYLTLYAISKLSDATAKKHIKKLKHIIKIAVESDIIPKNPIAGFKCGGDTNEVIPLEWEEVERIYNKNFGIQRLDEVADAYIFQCYTGFAYQDLYGLSKDNIILVGRQKERWLCKHRGKTGVMEMVPMLPIIESIIEKYKNHPICIMRNALLPILSNTNYNGYLKEIGAICGIKRELNTHLARHTFADIMLNLGMPLEDVSKMLGHKTTRTTQRYGQVRKNRIKENFDKFVRPAIQFEELNELINPIDNEKLSPQQANVIPFNSYTSTGSVSFNYSLAK